jgi:hypothetical protein
MVGSNCASPEPAKDEEQWHWIDLNVFFNGFRKAYQFNDIIYRKS